MNTKKLLKQVPDNLKSKLDEMDEDSRIMFFSRFKSNMKSQNVTFVMSLLGLHYLYLGRIGMFFIFLFTFGGFGVWAFIDFFRSRGLSKAVNQDIAMDSYLKVKSING